MTGTTTKETFVREYSRELLERNAVLFVGAGLSMPAGYVNWKDLLREVASDIGLDIDKEDDLVSIAQFHTNHQGNRGKLNQVLIDEFTRDVRVTENHKLIAKLPIEEIWTTNYDTLIEDSIRDIRRRVDIKHSTEQLATKMRAVDVTVLKMHGDVSLPDKAVITRDDYEEYSKHRQLFTEKLQGDLVSKTFLFIGFSFTDPNIEYILSRIRVLMGRGVRNHYCLMKKPSLPENSTPEKEADYRYAVRRLELRVQDLKRFGIQTVLLEDYTEITTILEELNRASHAREVFVSGSAHDYAPMGQADVEKLCRLIGKKIIDNSFNLINGFGLGIGGVVSMSAIESVYQRSGEQLERRVMLRPFPQETPEGMSRQAVWTKYREDMISQAGCSIFICGNKFDTESNTLVEANGVREEFDISRRLGKALIPIGATGHVAEKLWEEINADLTAYFPGVDVIKEFAIIGSISSSVEEIVDAVLSIVKKTVR